MEEGGTLDFEDLMDTGDEFPGFEIAKFTPVNENAGNDDGVLRTPEHEKDEEDYIVNENRNNPGVLNDDDGAKENDSEEVPGVEDIVTKIEGVVNEETSAVSDVALDEADVKAKEVENEEKTAAFDVELVEPTETGDNKSDVAVTVSDHEVESCVENDVDELKPTDHVSDEEHVKTVAEQEIEETEQKDDNKDDEDTSEPVPKKKKMYLKPPQKKMTLMNSMKTKEEESEDAEDDIIIGEESGSPRRTPDNEDSKNSIDISDDGDEDEENSEKKGDEDMEEKEEPHQQSFLSFLNLKPGSSKPKEVNEREKEQTLEKEFYSRKRLRTRKKVSYCEDVAQDDDEEYKAEEEDDEDEEDHQIGQRHSRSRSNSRRNSATSNYSNALQNLLPGVDLSCLQAKQLKISPTGVNHTVTIEGLRPQGNLKGLFECGLCGTFFNTASQFITHQESVHVGQKKNGKSAMETFRCEVCGFVLTNRFAYQEHKKMKHNRSGAITFSCSKCKINKFTDISALHKHQLVCGVPFCSTCGATFKAWVEVAEHRKKAHAPATPTRQWLNCPNMACSFKCVTQHEMRQHIESKHMANDVFLCNAPRCTLSFTTREQLTEHKKQAHASEFIVQYQCMECKNCFSSKTLLAEHQYLHTLEKLRKCDLCLRQFGNVTDLRKHKDVHAAKGTVRCQSCFRWCADKIELVNHVCAQKRRNIGIRLYFCDVCHKDFRSDEKMFVHRKEHKNFFQCGLCFLEFSSESEYFQHREVHGKFTCKECCEEMDEKDVKMHEKAHKYYIKFENIENDGKNERVMFLCPNLFNAIQA